MAARLAFQVGIKYENALLPRATVRGMWKHFRRPRRLPHIDEQPWARNNLEGWILLSVDCSEKAPLTRGKVPRPRPRCNPWRSRPVPVPVPVPGLACQTTFGISPPSPASCCGSRAHNLWRDINWELTGSRPYLEV